MDSYSTPFQAEFTAPELLLAGDDGRPNQSIVRVIALVILLAMLLLAGSLVQSGPVDIDSGHGAGGNAGGAPISFVLIR